MIQKWLFGIYCIQITFFTMSMEILKDTKNVISCQDGHGDIMHIERWKIEESKFLYEKQVIQDKLKLKTPIYTGLVVKKELELFSRALDWKKDETLLYYYARLSLEERHMLINVADESKLNAEKLSSILLMFYGTGLYMSEIIKLKESMLSDIIEWKPRLISNEEISDEEDEFLPPPKSRMYSYYNK